METDDKNQQSQETRERERERDPAGPVEPRGNPEPDEGATERGEDQLDKISGN